MSADRRKSAYHHGDLRSALIEEALDMLAEAGTEQLTLRKVAQRLGVSHAAPYRHFADKAALLAAIVARGFQDLERHIDAALAQADDPLGKLRCLPPAYVAWASEHRQLFHLMFGPEVVKAEHPEADAAAASALNRVEAVVAASQKAGLVTNRTPANELAVALWAFGHGLATVQLQGLLPPGFHSEEWLPRASALLYFGLAPAVA